MSNKYSFTISKFIKAKREDVFEAWANPAIESKWGCPEHCRQGPMEADVRVGGKYRNTMFDGDEEVTVFGTYLEVEPNHKLVFTSQWLGGTNPETVVTVELKDKNGGTELIMTQSGFDSTASAKGHEEGWASSLNKLVTLMKDEHEKITNSESKATN